MSMQAGFALRGRNPDVLTCIANELRRLIETHRLAVEDGGAEHVRVPTFDNRRGIDQKRKTRRVTFGKTVFAEAFDLATDATAFSRRRKPGGATWPNSKGPSSCDGLLCSRFSATRASSPQSERFAR